LPILLFDRYLVEHIGGSVERRWIVRYPCEGGEDLSMPAGCGIHYLIVIEGAFPCRNVLNHTQA